MDGVTDHDLSPRDVPEQDPPPPLGEWLLARLDEDEQVARAARPGPWDGRAGIVQAEDGQDVATSVGHDQSDPLDVGERMARGDAHHIARHDPARVLADVAAKRRIVEREDLHGEDDGTLRLLALPYADHPTYRAEYWTP